MSATHRLGLLLLVGFAFVLGSTLAGAQKAEPAKLEVQKWEYKILGHTSDDEVLNTLGKDGWELAAALSYARENGSMRYVFKRPKQ